MQKKIIHIILLAFLVQCSSWTPNSGRDYFHTTKSLSTAQMPWTSIALFQETAENALVIFGNKKELQDARLYVSSDQQKLRYQQAQQYCVRFRINLFAFFLHHPAQNLPPPDNTVIA